MSPVKSVQRAKSAATGIPSKNEEVLKGPKKPLSAYIYFSMEMSPKLREQTGCSVTEAAKLIGSKWSELQSKDKVRYIKLNEVDK